jgi:diadenosine tetraphosphate (Ap4A) HIT family hydrolase
MTPAPTNHCDFCNELSGSARNSFARIYKGHPESRILLRSRESVVIPSLGQIVEGYLLVLPIDHWKALGDLTEPRLDEFAATSERVGNILKNQYGPYILFEHGARTEGAGGCGIYHAHLHATPLGAIPDPVETLKATYPYTELVRLSELSKKSAGMSSYLFYQDSKARVYLFNSGPLPSQYMRKLLADALNEKDWNWREAGREEHLLATLQRLSSHFDLPGRSVQTDQLPNAHP